MGVPQGSILSVTLFALKINSIVKSVSSGVECSLYVDDFLICYRSKFVHIICYRSKFVHIIHQEMGVPQGSILSVTLFALKINTIVKSVSPGVECSLYVYDFLICYRSKFVQIIERHLQQVKKSKVLSRALRPMGRR